MFNWFRSAPSPDPAPVSIPGSAIELQQDELINLRYQSGGLSFEHNLSRRKKAFSALSGSHPSAFKGRGMDFDEVRLYQAGDDIRNIDWNVTARTNRVHTKVFKEEKERPVYFVVDFSASMHFATRGRLKSIQAARLAVLSAWINADHHSRVGGIIITPQGLVSSPPRSGHKGVLRLIHALLETYQTSLQMRHHPASGELHSQHLVQQLQRQISNGSLIMLISDLQFCDSRDLHHFHYLSRHNDLISALIYDPLEVELPPPGQYALLDPALPASAANWQDQVQILDSSDMHIRHQYRQQFIQRDALLEQAFQQMGASFIRLATNAEPLSLLQQFLGKSRHVARVAKHKH